MMFRLTSALVVVVVAVVIHQASALAPSGPTRPVCFFCDPASTAGVEYLQDHGFDVEVLKTVTNDVLLANLRSKPQTPKVVVLSSANQITKEMVEAAPSLAAVGRAGVGVDNIDVNACADAGVPVLNAPFPSADAAAEITLALALCLARRIPEADASMARGEFKRRQLIGTSLRGKTLALLGTGRIGKGVAAHARAIGMKVSALAKASDSNVGQATGGDARAVARAAALEAACIERVEDFETLLRNADVMSLHMPLSDSSRGLIGARELGWMKPTSYLINTARAGIVDEEALLAALQGGQLAGAAFDVWSVEGAVEGGEWKAAPSSAARALAQLPNVVATPHIGASTYEAALQIQLDIAVALEEAVFGDDGGVPGTLVGEGSEAAVNSARQRLRAAGVGLGQGLGRGRSSANLSPVVHVTRFCLLFR